MKELILRIKDALTAGNMELGHQAIEQELIKAGFKPTDKKDISRLVQILACLEPANEPGHDLSNHTIGFIAQIIQAEWIKPHFTAVPYINAMLHLDSITDTYGMDSGKEIVLRFLSSAHTWRGPTARVIKQELQKRLK